MYCAWQFNDIDTAARSPIRETLVADTKPVAGNAGRIANSNKTASAILEKPAIVSSEVAARNAPFRSRSDSPEGRHGRFCLQVTHAVTDLQFIAHVSVEFAVGDSMATLATATAVPVLRNCAVFTTDMIAFAFKVIRVTSCTVRLKCGV